VDRPGNLVGPGKFSAIARNHSHCVVEHHGITSRRHLLLCWAHEKVQCGVRADCDRACRICELRRRTHIHNTTGGPVQAGITVADGIVYGGRNDNTSVRSTHQRETKIWSYLTGGSVNSDIVMAGDAVYFGGNDHKKYALDSATGRKKWACATGGQADAGASVLAKMIFAGSDDDNLYALQA